MKLIISHPVMIPDQESDYLEKISGRLVLLVLGKPIAFDFVELIEEQQDWSFAQKLAFIVCREPVVEGDTVWREVILHANRSYSSSAWRPKRQPEDLSVLVLMGDLDIDHSFLGELADAILTYWDDPI